MITLASLEACTGCTACKAICPKGAIMMVADREGFLRPHINTEKCITCHACEHVCPVLHPGGKDESPICYAAKTNDGHLRMESTSGGIFSELAKAIFVHGGVVFGCVWEHPNLVAIHTKAENEEALAAMRGSKYVQSDLRETFREAKVILELGRYVLFSGTPCQIAGLNRFLGKRYENLLTVEIMCYGVPSPLLFEIYKKEIEKYYKKRLLSIACRQKKDSWRQSLFVHLFYDGSEAKELIYDNFYAKIFFANIALRPSCHQCLVREGRSAADITLGDFWGIEHVAPEIDDNRGTSAVLLHTPKGQLFWNDIRSRVTSKSVKYQEILAGNPFYRYVVSPHKKRDYFMKSLMRKSIRPLFRYCIYGAWHIRFLRKVIAVLRYVWHKLKKY